MYYARYPDATAGEIEAWLRDRGFDVGLSGVEDCMAALDSRPGWRTGWINRNIHHYAAGFDPDQYLATRSYGEESGWQVMEDESGDEVEDEGEEYEDDEVEEEEPIVVEEYGGKALAPASSVPMLGGEDRLPGIVLAVVGLAVSAVIAALAIVAFR